MVGVPYTVLGVLSFLIYRGVKKNSEYFNNMEKAGEPGDAVNSNPATIAGHDETG